MESTDLTPKRPILAATIDETNIDKIQFPIAVSPKIDGIRCLVHPQLGPVTRSFKPVPNEFIRDTLKRTFMTYGQYLDGEIVTVKPNNKELGSGFDHDDFNTIQSNVMTRHGTPAFRFLVFDWYDPSEGFWKRHSKLCDLTADERYARYINRELLINDCGILVGHKVCHNKEELLWFEQWAVEKGYEGIMTRTLEGPYKEGRSTFKQGYLCKLKRWSDSEGTVVGFTQLMVNHNSPMINVFGLQERPKRKDDLIPINAVGAIILNTEWGELHVGSGLDVSLREVLWYNQEHYLGQKVSFKYQKHGMQSLPRFPIFRGFRHEEDS